MGKTLLLLLAIAALFMLGSIAARSLRALAQTTEDTTLPKTVQTISYVLLIVLMFGVVTGWLGGL